MKQAADLQQRTKKKHKKFGAVRPVVGEINISSALQRIIYYNYPQFSLSTFGQPQVSL